jgi:hypothetical protein
MVNLFIQIDIKTWDDLPKIKGAYWTSPNDSTTSRTMVKKFLDPQSVESRKYFKATSASWFKPEELFTDEDWKTIHHRIPQFSDN